MRLYRCVADKHRTLESKQYFPNGLLLLLQSTLHSITHPAVYDRPVFESKEVLPHWSKANEVKSLPLQEPLHNHGLFLGKSMYLDISVFVENYKAPETYTKCDVRDVCHVSPNSYIKICAAIPQHFPIRKSHTISIITSKRDIHQAWVIHGHGTKCIVGSCMHCRRLGLTPTQWKKARLVPIFKDGDVNALGNYRQIALLSHVRKFVEMALDRIIRRQYKFHKSQLGFQRSKRNGTRPPPPRSVQAAGAAAALQYSTSKAAYDNST